MVKALVKDADSDHTCVRYPDANEDVGLLGIDSGDYDGYRLVLWGDTYLPDERGFLVRSTGIKPPVIRYLKPER